MGPGEDAITLMINVQDAETLLNGGLAGIRGGTGEIVQTEAGKESVAR